MPENEATTQQNILDAGRREFLKNGFRGASLRGIVKDAGVTTGAFYGYYRSKEALFDALVGEQYETLMEKFGQAQSSFATLPAEEQFSHLEDIAGDCMEWMVGYIYQHFDAFKLLLCCAEGTRYENFIHTLVEVEVVSTRRFFAAMESIGRPLRPVESQLLHILASGLFSAFFEIVIHEMPREQAVRYVRELREFHTAGWLKIMGL